MELLWDALAAFREDCIPEGDTAHDAQWDEITTAMAFIAEDLGISTEPEDQEGEEPEGPELKTYHVVMAYSARVYGSCDIEAESAAHAAEMVRAMDMGGDSSPWDQVYDVEHETSHAHSILSINEEGDDVNDLDDIELTRDDDPHTIISAEELAAMVAA